jgi:hypothetical protein
MGEPEPPVSEEDEERQFWILPSLSSMKAIWDNEEDDVYEQLLTDEQRKQLRIRG